MAELDQTDRHLLALLQANARESAANLARALGIARTTVVARIARLEKIGVIAGYGVRLGRQMEDNAILAFCGLSVQPKASPAVVRALQRFPEIEELNSVSGPVDYMAVIRCDSHARLDKLLDEIGMLDGVNHTQTSIVLARKIDRRRAAG
ncbi:DNA-binding Lrp family transcriptional regulator [Cupriavidus metallidurans]|jgi:DNA-binding Lrp family transcriptional regulator|uniref:Transcriptional regulator, AsnC/Lrp-family n=1 Tax=Cupriavidus metallidurans (strain ATCC 43123 / DSM 2839 / NBRC 102507 / CH34) TaxID=266264 RepID=Q1LIE5_CUPMC|nr:MULTISPECIES: Lrp/AsnC family transcriptional regulator [Cupriavidus]HBO77560.1 Lrp/AsnC family transcriptional regulator [Cupriavidus sp.]ABF10081.1 transcriptional regulator, AsnC/Lrp-family [Cupriavidus metallidurans CH34]ELA00339.1 AsnC/Lrp family transcriptional regulator [Cupriavidus sp. HMR-1]KWW39876.1 Leucine-responsive regulatory protein [Cupriavidus metallidurans]MDE4919542.1 Lrp/AsnC family transcriptional regulator [Cupriavidus metallidurans]